MGHPFPRHGKGHASRRAKRGHASHGAKKRSFPDAQTGALFSMREKGKLLDALEVRASRGVKMGTLPGVCHFSMRGNDHTSRCADMARFSCVMKTGTLLDSLQGHVS